MQQPKPKAPHVPSARGMTIDAEALKTFAVGDRVFHQKFGYGEILDMDMDLFEIAFEGGTKHVKAGFVTPAAAAGQDDIPF